MAKIIGTSGAWKSICRELKYVGLQPNNIADISKFLSEARVSYEKEKEAAAQEIEKNIETFRKENKQLEINLDSDVTGCQKRINADINLCEIEIALLKDKKGLFQKFLNFSKIRKRNKKLNLLKQKFEKCPQYHREKINLKKKTLRDIENNRKNLIENKLVNTRNKILLLEKTLKSPDLQGALAELEVIENLKTLPASHYVISDINLEADKSIYFDGEYLLSAQIDHVVISPAGIFVIEVKNWSKTFVESGDYYDPYQQVKRATYLCYKIIGERYNLKTRSIIAYRGSIPKKPQDSYAKVLPVGKVKGYISWFKDKLVTDETVENIAESLSFLR